MKIISKTSLILFVTLTIVSCSKSNSDETTLGNCATVCTYTIASGEKAATVPNSLDGTYELTYHSAQAGSPYTNGTKAKFTISNNTLTVEIEGKDCITIKNPVLIGSNNYKFKDSCRDNIAFNVSPNNNGDFNEINVEPLGTGWFGQFSK
ncbi:MAG: hypothetical protein HWD85_09805 [Flavobacteriaceae bacterium]|nr:hypothetical protein [Flavobacteriaceae bacterium]